jgi:7,8-dihydropterin-6-yl-methyl-4-(beta-D-ribofuranosyl)aminobenzene 5'-phosphate synthase
MNQLGIAPEQIGTIVISHAHGDHTGGLSDILQINIHAEIYVLASAGARIPERKVISVSQPLQISSSVISIGELKDIEQSLAVKTSRGMETRSTRQTLTRRQSTKNIRLLLAVT